MSPGNKLIDMILGAYNKECEEEKATYHYYEPGNPPSCCDDEAVKTPDGWLCVWCSNYVRKKITLYPSNYPGTSSVVYEDQIRPMKEWLKEKK